ENALTLVAVTILVAVGIAGRRTPSAGRALAAGDRVGPAQPARQIDVAAARRAERAEGRRRGILADGAPPGAFLRLRLLLVQPLLGRRGGRARRPAPGGWGGERPRQRAQTPLGWAAPLPRLCGARCVSPRGSRRALGSRAPRLFHATLSRRYRL